MFNFCVNNKNVAFRIDKDITGNDIPNQVISVGVAPLVILLHKAEGCHVCVNHNLSGGYGVGYANLTENRLYGTTVKASKAMKPVGSIGKKHIMHHNLFEQCYNTAAVHQIVYFIDRIVGYIGIVGIQKPLAFAICSAMRCSRSNGVTSVWPVPDCASCNWQSRWSSLAIAAIRLFSASCAPSLPCETDL